MAGRQPRRTQAAVRWLVELDGRDQLELAPLGLFATSARRTLVLDPDTGSTRCELPKGRTIPAEDVVLVLAGSTLAGFDPRTGECLHRSRVPGSSDHTPVFFRDRRLLLTLGSDLVALRFDDVREAPAEEWRLPFPEHPWIDAVTRDLVIAGFDRYLEGKRPSLVAWSVADGTELLRWKGVEDALADDRILVVSQGRKLLGLDPRGRPRWKAAGGLFPFALTPTAVLCHGSRDRLVSVHRRSGRATPVDLPSGVAGFLSHLWRWAVSDDLLVCAADDRLEGMDLRGRPRWSWQAPKKGSKVGQPHIFGGRVHARVGPRQVVCLEVP